MVMNLGKHKGWHGLDLKLHLLESKGVHMFRTRKLGSRVYSLLPNYPRNNPARKRGGGKGVKNQERKCSSPQKFPQNRNS